LTHVTLSLSLADRLLSFTMDDRERQDYVVYAALKDGLAGYEEPFPAYLASLVCALKGSVVDVGANTGLYSLLAAAASSEVVVHAFEPVAAVADGFVLNAALNSPLKDRLQLHRIALSDFFGEALFHETMNPYFMTTTSGLNAAFSKSHGETKTYLVPTTTLDACVMDKGLGDISFIKIDVEGHEKEVIAGAEMTVLTRRPFIGVELLWDADYAYFEKFLLDNGYVDGVLQPGSLRFTYFPEFIKDGWNHILIPEEQRHLAEACAREIGLRVVTD
jgi:FkbM family methyltransferase